MSHQSVIPFDTDRPAVIPLPFERRTTDSQMGWDYFLEFCKAPAEMTVTQFVSKLSLAAQETLDHEPLENDWARRKLALWEWRANLGSKMTAAEASRVSRKILKKLDKLVDKLIRRAQDEENPEPMALAQINVAAGVIQKLAGAANGGPKVNVSTIFGAPPGAQPGPQPMNLGENFYNPGV